MIHGVRIHLVTSRKPMAGAITAHDKLVLMETGSDDLASFINEIVAANPEMKTENVCLLGQAKADVSAEFVCIDYPQLVEMIVRGEANLSW